MVPFSAGASTFCLQSVDFVCPPISQFFSLCRKRESWIWVPEPRCFLWRDQLSKDLITAVSCDYKRLSGVG